MFEIDIIYIAGLVFVLLPAEALNSFQTWTRTFKAYPLYQQHKGFTR